ncbi:hypothetical protein [Desulfonatronum lacustre]|nr:hypothetical protein [Desulfonatronum lacustre]
MSPFSAAVQTVFSSDLTALVVATQAEPADFATNVGNANKMGANCAA